MPISGAGQHTSPASTSALPLRRSASSTVQNAPEPGPPCPPYSAISPPHESCNATPRILQPPRAAPPCNIRRVSLALLPITPSGVEGAALQISQPRHLTHLDRKRTRLNSSH